MRTIIVSGFLGSGKTTFILQAIIYLSTKRVKFALIVNEIGVDNMFLKQEGYKPVSFHLQDILKCLSREKKMTI